MFRPGVAAQFQEMLERQLKLHVKSRTSRYPCVTNPADLVYRFKVPDEMVEWNVSKMWIFFISNLYTHKYNMRMCISDFRFTVSIE